MRKGLVLSLLALAACSSETPRPAIDPARLAEHVQKLSSDEFGGRGPGTEGERLTVAYLSEQFEAAGAAPAGDGGTYLQKVPLVGVTTITEQSTLRWQGGEIAWGDQAVGNNLRQQAEAVVDAEAVFVGHGIVAEDYGWDDYKGVDVTGKYVLLFTNEPPSDDPDFFGGKALTYYGRWTFKYEEALRHGAAGVLIVHTDETAGYPYSVVRNSWSGQQPFVAVAEGESALQFAGWTTGELGLAMLQRSAATKGKSLDELVAMANEPGFEPIPLDVRIQGKLASEVEELPTQNVVAKIEGSEKPDEAVLYTAHWDHLGTGPEVDGDGIYNGAVDNATGCAVLLELARAFAAMDPKPARTIVFAAVAAEEGGLRGSEYYAHHPAIPAAKTAVDLNYDGILPLPVTSDMSAAGYERTTLGPVVEKLAAEFGYTLTPDQHPEQGYYFRSDHFSLAKVGVPAFSIRGGSQVVDAPAGTGEAAEEAYRTNRYHQPADEFDPSWDFSGLAKLAEFGIELGLRVAAMPELPGWREGEEFSR